LFVDHTVVPVWNFSAGTASAGSSSRQYQQYKNSDTYKMVHGEDKDIDSEQEGNNRHSLSKEDTTNDNKPGNTDSHQSKSENDGGKYRFVTPDN
jgi:hypothetical protein